jgi:hypothetical protein
LNLPRITPDERLTGIAWPVTLLAGGVVPPTLPYLMDDRYDGTDHQAFDPNRDNRHFKRGSICGLLGRLGASRVLGRLRGPVQRVTLPFVSSWASAAGNCNKSSIVSSASPRRPGLRPLAAPMLLWRQACQGAMISKSALVTEANAKFKRLLT